jgi:sugar phosphate permease
MQNTSPFRWAILGMTTYAQAAAAFVAHGIGPLGALWKDMFRLSQAQTGLLLSSANVAAVFVMLFVGSAIDRYGERLLISIGLLGLSCIMIGAAFVTSFGALLLLLSCIGVCYATSQPGGSKAIIDWFPARERALAMGIRQIGIPLGGALAASLLPFTATCCGLSSALFLQSGIALTGGLVFAVMYRERDPPRVDHGDTGHLLENLKKTSEQADYRVLFAGMALVSLQFVLIAHVITYLTAAFGVSLATAGALLATIQMSGIVGRIVLAWVSDRHWGGNRLRPLSLCIWAAAAGVILLAAIPPAPIWLLAVLCAWIGFFGMGWYSLFIVHISETAPSNRVALTVGFALTANQVAIVVAPPLFGVLVDLQGGYRLAWTLLALLIFLSGISLRRRSQAAVA